MIRLFLGVLNKLTDLKSSRFTSSDHKSLTDTLSAWLYRFSTSARQAANASRKFGSLSLVSTTTSVHTPLDSVRLTQGTRKRNKAVKKEEEKRNEHRWHILGQMKSITDIKGASNHAVFIFSAIAWPLSTLPRQWNMHTTQIAAWHAPTCLRTRLNRWSERIRKLERQTSAPRPPLHLRLPTIENTIKR